MLPIWLSLVSPAPADCRGDLGPAQDYNAWLFEDVDWRSHIGGKVAAGGDVRLSDFSLGTERGRGPVLEVGGQLEARQGSIHGEAVVRGASKVEQSVSFSGGAQRAAALAALAEGERELRRLSSRLAAQQGQGQVQVESWGGLRLATDEEGLVIFDVRGEDISRARAIEIDAPAGATAVINVRGDARLSGLSLQVRGGLDERDVLLHFVNAERLTLTSVGLEAAVMAPQAEVWLESASLRGTLIASSLSGSGSLEPAAFRGSLPCG